MKHQEAMEPQCDHQVDAPLEDGGGLPSRHVLVGHPSVNRESDFAHETRAERSPLAELDMGAEDTLVIQHRVAGVERVQRLVEPRDASLDAKVERPDAQTEPVPAQSGTELGQCQRFNRRELSLHRPRRHAL